ncbi:MAG TPA: hypothetical protein VHF89_11745 [Solirubrobacteraceae bacterium]|nr:hypothetical protein [Solirubrobacteraceae bacterium]
MRPGFLSNGAAARLLAAGVVAAVLAPAPAAGAAGRCASAAPPRWAVEELGVLREARTPADRLPRRVRGRLPIDRVAHRFVRRLERAPEEERPAYVVPGAEGCRRPRRYLCFVSLTADGHFSVCRRARRGRVFSPSYYGAHTAGDRAYVQDLVPDGVADVEVTLRGGETQTVTVRDNHWLATFPASPEGPPFLPLRVRWLDAAGAEIARHDFPADRRATPRTA